MRTMFKLFALAVVFVLLLGLAATGFAAPTAEIALTPDKIEIGTRFNGGEVKVTGRVPEGSQVIIQAISPEKRVALSKKGKVSGVWMTVEKTQVSGMPAMFKVYTSGKMDDIPADVQKELGIDSDFSAVKSLAKVTEKHEEKTVTLEKARAEEFVNGLISLYREKNLYTVDENAVKVEGERFEAVLQIPADIPRGETRVLVYAVGSDGSVVASSSALLKVEAVGLVRTLGDMATHNAVAYGILAVGVALVTGILIAQFFKWLQKVVFKEEHVEVGH
ncbi:MAG: TIGR02186 family protein [Bacillota bacterium]